MSASPKRARMAQWVLSCRNYHKTFPHSEMEPRPDDRRFDPLWPYRPEFPEGGLSVDCPTLQAGRDLSAFRIDVPPVIGQISVAHPT